MCVQSSSASARPSLQTSLPRLLTHNPTASASLPELTASLTTSHHRIGPGFWPSASPAWITPRNHLCTLLSLFSAQQPDGIFQNVRNTFISLLKTLQSFPSHLEDNSQCSFRLPVFVGPHLLFSPLLNSCSSVGLLVLS